MIRGVRFSGQLGLNGSGRCHTEMVLDDVTNCVPKHSQEGGLRWVFVAARPGRVTFHYYFKNFTAEQAGAPGDTTNTQDLKMSRTCAKTLVQRGARRKTIQLYSYLDPTSALPAARPGESS